MDEGDRGSEAEEADRARALAKRRPTLPIIGVCHFCGMPTRGLFCPSLFNEDGKPDGCQQDYEKEHRK